jgi:ParB family chromosome partitioning protein
MNEDKIKSQIANVVGAPVPSSTDNPNPSPYFNNSIFWIDVEKIKPNPYQPRRDFEPNALRDLADSIRMYGLLQPLVVTRKEIIKPDGGLAVEYELISGERRLRASKLCGLSQIPAIIRAGQEDARVKLELAIIENLQREDINSVDRAYAFQRLADEFGMKHAQIAEKVGKSREYVTNTIRLLALPKHMLTALSEGKITEGHTRPLLMLSSRPEEQETLFKEILFRKITVRDAEQFARGIAKERIRKREFNDPEIDSITTKLNEVLGTRVAIEKREVGGKLVIDFFSHDDLRHLFDVISHTAKPDAAQVQVVQATQEIPEQQNIPSVDVLSTQVASKQVDSQTIMNAPDILPEIRDEHATDITVASDVQGIQDVVYVDARDANANIDVNPVNSPDEELYSIKNFSL